MIDKTAIINAAQKHASKGNIDGAIAEWEKLLINGQDGNIQNTIGDLYLRKGSEEQAIVAFTKAAEIFRKDGFYPKAIAIYKKILNILPNNVEAIIALAKLNATRGLNAAAADYYFMAADIYHRNGHAENATTAVERILQLSETDLITRKKIADWFIKTDMKPRAANEYAAIASSYIEKDDIANAEQLFTRATELDPDNISSFLGLSRLMEKTGETTMAFQYLEKALSIDHNSKDAMIAYSELAIKYNKRDEAEITLLKLIDNNPSYDRPRKLLSNLYLDENEPEKAWEQILPCIDNAINDKKREDAIKMLDKFKELHPVPVRERLIDIYRLSEDSDNLAKELKELAKHHEEQGSNDDAIRLYTELLEEDPGNTEAADKIKALEIIVEPVVEPIAETATQTEGMQVRIDPAIIDDILTVTPEVEIPARATSISYSEAMTEKISEAEFFAKQGMNEEAAAIYEKILNASPDNTDVKKRLKELRSVAGQSEEIIVKKMYEDVSVTKDELNVNSTTRDLQGIFDKFSKDEDHEARYRTGLECRQKGHLDEAIKEFRIAAEDSEKNLVCKSMIALCFMDKGAFADAVTEFSQVLAAMSPNDASYLRIKYELAVAYQKDGNDKRALELYSAIKAREPHFKEVNQKIAALQHLIPKPVEPKPETPKYDTSKPETPKPETPKSDAPKPEADGEKPKKKKSRISYI